MADDKDGGDTIAMAAGVAALKTTILAGLAGAVGGALTAAAIGGGIAFAPMLLGAAVGGAGLAAAGAAYARNSLPATADTLPSCETTPKVCSPCAASVAKEQEAGTHHRNKLATPPAAEKTR